MPPIPAWTREATSAAMAAYFSGMGMAGIRTSTAQPAIRESVAKSLGAAQAPLPAVPARHIVKRR